ncbi:MAG: helix-turn-helix transcriptional regulator [Spirochaetia bacterium]|nr:helix-turn-helix transcriptional regulator [Spirochaetia bacterium]
MLKTERMPALVSHTFWRERPGFMRGADTSEWTCLIVPAKGSFRFRIGDRHGTMSRGSMVLCPPGLVFERRVVKGPISFHTFFLQWTSQNGAVENGYEGIPCGSLLLKNERRLRETLDWLAEDEPDSIWNERNRIQHLLADLWFHYLETAETKTTELSETDPAMEKIEARLREGSAEAFRFKDLAREAGLTPVQLVRRFRARYQQTPEEYFIALKLRRAGRLLIDSEKTLDEIAGHCGYETGFSLSRAFRKQQGLRPTEYRRKYRI